jgi:hypothetical protein
VTTTGTVQPWGRRRLQRVLLLLAAAAVVLLAGLGYAVHSALTTTQAVARTAPAEPAPASGQAAAGTVGPADVATGFPRTPAGAVGQLAAITTTVLQGMSIERAHAVHDAWAAPGAVPAQDWVLVANIQAFLTAADGIQPGVDPGVTVAAVPVAGQVKGVDGPGWVLACVLLDVQARAATTARIAYGHCERMHWDPNPLTKDSRTAERWVIGPGKPPAPAPSTWPGTDLAHQAGWRTWATGPDQ